jgi:hypothetical protein
MNLNTKALAITAVFVGSIAMANAVVLTQNTSQTIVAGSVACHAGGVTSDNGYSRGYTLSAHGIFTAFNVTAVQFGVEVATAGASGGGFQSMTVNIYDGFTIVGGNLVFGSLAGTAVTSVANGSLFMQNVAISGTINSGLLAVEVDVPNSIGGDGDSFFIGSNGLGQTGPSYLRSVGCGVPNNAPLSALGFPNQHDIINVEGTAVPEPASMAALSLGALALIRRRRNK